MNNSTTTRRGFLATAGTALGATALATVGAHATQSPATDDLDIADDLREQFAYCLQALDIAKASLLEMRRDPALFDNDCFCTAKIGDFLHATAIQQRAIASLGVKPTDIPPSAKVLEVRAYCHRYKDNLKGQEKAFHALSLACDSLNVVRQLYDAEDGYVEDNTYEIATGSEYSLYSMVTHLEGVMHGQIDLDKPIRHQRDRMKPDQLWEKAIPMFVAHQALELVVDLTKDLDIDGAKELHQNAKLFVRELSFIDCGDHYRLWDLREFHKAEGARLKPLLDAIAAEDDFHDEGAENGILLALGLALENLDAFANDEQNGDFVRGAIAVFESHQAMWRCTFGDGTDAKCSERLDAIRARLSQQ